MIRFDQNLWKTDFGGTKQTFVLYAASVTLGSFPTFAAVRANDCYGEG